VKDFFISYNKADRSWAEWIAWQLEEAGYTVVVQAWDFRPGANFVLEMQRATTEAARTIAVLSPDYLAAGFTQPEWAAAFAQDPTGEKGTLLPVRVRECDPAGLLPQIVYVDLVGQEETAAKDALLAGVRRGRAKPTTPPGFPGTARRVVTERPRFPGALPPIWNVPLRRNPNFTGRETLLADLRTALTSGQPAALTQAISGLGGVGKTQLALEYAYRHTADYAVVWWVRAEEPATLSADFAALAGPLDLPEKEATEQPVVVGAARRWLEHNAGWLLVFDNAPDPAALRDFLPQGGAGHVLITSRYPAWRGVASPLSVRVLDRAESVAFLLRRTGQTDQTAAGVLAGELGDLPLALEQAGAYIEATGRALADYLNLFRQRQGDLLSRGQPSTDYPATVATTWEISFQQIQQTSPAAADLLNLCAFLAPDDIPRELLGEGAEYLPESLAAVVTDPLAGDEALAALRRYSLVDVSGDALSVHRLVQAVARDRLAEEARRTWAEAAVRLVAEAFPSGERDPSDVRTWPECARLLPHALAAAGHAEALQVAAEATGRLLNQAGLYLWGRAEFAEAKEALERALAIDEAAYGPQHPNVATDVNNLGNVLHGLGDLAGARAASERALAIDEAAYGPQHPNVATDVNNLGSVLRDLGDLAGARAAFERALAIDEAAYGPQHPTVAIRVNNLAGVLRGLGDLAGARAAFERALAIDEAAYGPEHPAVARAVNNLGTVLGDLGDLVGARAAFQRALGVCQRFLGEDHPSTVTVRNNLASLGELGDP
jgi:tetratricopeptide (TPR) repeat protein